MPIVSDLGADADRPKLAGLRPYCRPPLPPDRPSAVTQLFRVRKPLPSKAGPERDRGLVAR
jgi:hypothetical protein